MVIWVWGVGEGGVEDSHVFFFYRQPEQGHRGGIYDEVTDTLKGWGFKGWRVIRVRGGGGDGR